MTNNNKRPKPLRSSSLRIAQDPIDLELSDVARASLDSSSPLSDDYEQDKNGLRLNTSAEELMSDDSNDNMFQYGTADDIGSNGEYSTESDRLKNEEHVIDILANVDRDVNDDNDEHMVVHQEDSIGKTLAGIAGNVLEWYDFAVFGYFSDILGDVFFPPHQDGHAAIIESFAVFGGAFFMRPLGGVMMGFIGDKYGSRKALTISIFLMAFPTFAMGCLPGYSAVGDAAIILLTLVRLLQGLSVGGQIMSSLIFTLERHPKQKWGLYGSYVMAAANLGTLLGGVVATILRRSLTDEQLYAWGWRIPFLSGILVSISGFYLKNHGGDDEGHHGHGHGSPSQANSDTPNPIKLAFSRSNIRSLLAASMVPLLWSSGFYLTFVWMAVYMADLIETPVPNSFAVNSASLAFSVCLFFPVAGWMSDKVGRKKVMSVGGLVMAVGSPIMLKMIGTGNATTAFCAQMILGISLSLWGAPMMAWLAESFEPAARLTSVSIGYNIAQACGGGLAPAIATELVDRVGVESPGYYITIIASIALIGLLCIAPRSPVHFSVLSSKEEEESQTNSRDTRGDRELI